MKQYIYGAKSREEATLAEQVINHFTNEDFQEAYDTSLKCPCMNWLIQIYDKLNGENDLYQTLTDAANAGCFYAHGFTMSFIMTPDIPREMTEIAAEQGCPVSQCIMHRKTGDAVWAQMAADQGYSEGFYLLGKFREAAELGHYQAMVKYANQCTGPEGWYWVCKAWKYQHKEDETFLKWHNCTEYDDLCQVGILLPGCTSARAVYLEHCKRVRAQIDMWTLIAKQLGVYKDIRLLIARIIWKNRVYRLE